MEELRFPDNPDLKENIAIAKQITQIVFTPTEPEAITWFNNPSHWRITYMASHRRTGKELYIELYKDDPRSRESVVPEGLSLPAIRIDVKGTDDAVRHVTSAGVISTYTTSSGEEEYLTTTELMEGEKPGEEVQTVENISPREETTLLDPGDYEDGEYGGG